MKSLAEVTERSQPNPTTIIDSCLKIYTPVSAKELMRKKNSKEDEQTLKELISAYCRSQAKCQLVQTNYMK